MRPISPVLARRIYRPHQYGLARAEFKTNSEAERHSLAAREPFQGRTRHAHHQGMVCNGGSDVDLEVRARNWQQ
jgi:hypothetical protein